MGYFLPSDFRIRYITIHIVPCLTLLIGRAQTKGRLLGIYFCIYKYLFLASNLFWKEVAYLFKSSVQGRPLSF